MSRSWAGAGMTEEITAFANAMVFDGVSAGLREGCVRVAAGTIVEVDEGSGTDVMLERGCALQLCPRLLDLARDAMSAAGLGDRGRLLE